MVPLLFKFIETSQLMYSFSLEASFQMVPSLSMIEPHDTGTHLEGLDASFQMVTLLSVI